MERVDWGNENTFRVDGLKKGDFLMIIAIASILVIIVAVFVFYKKRNIQSKAKKKSIVEPRNKPTGDDDNFGEVRTTVPNHLLSTKVKLPKDLLPPSYLT